jgi:undecaprenyl-phosphate galactose phosphotransferase
MQYDFWQDSFKLIKALFFSYLIVLSLLTLMQTKIIYSEIFISIYFLLALIIMPALKRVLKHIIFLFPFFKTRVKIIGTKEEVLRFKQEIQKNWYLGQRYSKENYENVIIISKGLSTQQLNQYILKYSQKTKELHLVPYITDINFAHSNIVEYSNIRLNTIQVENKLLTRYNIFIKNIFDMILVFALFPLLIPIHIIISLLIKYDSKGEVFFKQKRLGKDSSEFICYKYRTMYENSQTILDDYLLNNPEEESYYERFHKYQNDPRITKIGKILRQTSLDELPQFINILKTEMSFVGPRPYMLQEKEKLGEKKDLILKVKPGITGLWQVSGRNNLTFIERTKLETWYIKNWSLWADLVILMKTIKVVLFKVGAK